MDDRFLFDIETDGLLDAVTKIHCIKVFNLDTEAVYTFDPSTKQTISDGISFLASASFLTGHNIQCFDVPVIQKFYPEEFAHFSGKIFDTLIAARTVFPDIKALDYNLYNKGRLPAALIGSHSLEAYGYRMGELKGTFGKTTDWQKWTPKMSEYCEQDVKVNVKLFNKILTKGCPEDALQLEHSVVSILERQEAYGFKFDVSAAERLYASITLEKLNTEKKLVSAFPPFYKKKLLRKSSHLKEITKSLDILKAVQ